MSVNFIVGKLCHFTITHGGEVVSLFCATQSKEVVVYILSVWRSCVFRVRLSHYYKRLFQHHRMTGQDGVFFFKIWNCFNYIHGTNFKSPPTSSHKLRRKPIKWTMWVNHIFIFVMNALISIKVKIIVIYKSLINYYNWLATIIYFDRRDNDLLINLHPCADFSLILFYKYNYVNLIIF
jgi:hypothetical protein